MKYEIFCDHSYYDMWCVREAGSRTFGEGWHVSTKEEAETLKKKLEEKEQCQTQHS